MVSDPALTSIYIKREGEKRRLMRETSFCKCICEVTTVHILLIHPLNIIISI